MTDYQPLDLSAHCNAGVDLLGPDARPPVGAQTFHGLPFQIAEGRCYIARGGDLGKAPVTIPIGQKARHLIFAHRLLESKMLEGAPIGGVAAHYVFHLAGGETIRVPIRERFETGVVPPGWGQLAFLAVPDQKNGLQSRYEGKWGSAGNRQTEATQGGPRAYYLWDWENPQPDLAIESVEVIPEGPRFLIAALTLGHLEEDPFVRSGAREVRIDLPQPEDAAKPFGLEVEVDRGVAT